MDFDIKNNIDNNYLSVNDYIEILKNSMRNETPDLIPSEALKGLKYQLKKNSESKKIAQESGAFDVSIQLLIKFQLETKIQKSVLKLIIHIIDHENKLLNAEAIACQMSILERFHRNEEFRIKERKKEVKSSSCLRALLRWMKICCIKNETNRRAIFDSGVTNSVKIILKNGEITAFEFHDLCSFLRCLVLEDDPDFECGNGLFRARKIAEDILSVVVESLKKFKNEKKIVAQVLKTIIALLVRNELSNTIHDNGGIKSIIETIRLFDKDEEIYCLGFKLFQILASNEESKMYLVENGVVSLVVSALLNFETGSTAVSGLGCTIALILNSRRNSELFYDLEILRLTIETMKRYPESRKVQRQGVRVISKISKSKNYRSKIDPARAILDSEIEAVLEIAMRMLDDYAYIEDDFKEAFHQLGLNSELKNRWTKTPTDLKGERN